MQIARHLGDRVFDMALGVEGGAAVSMYRPPLDDGMVIYATRYCLPRQSYAVGDCADYLIAHWDRLEPNTRAVIVRDIEEHLADGRYGMEMDKRQWERVLERSRHD